MTTETTEPAAAVIGDQRAAIEALASLIDEHKTLPAAYITIHAPFPKYNAPARLDLQAETPHAFEQWREALGVPQADVQLHITTSNTWLAADTKYQGVSLHFCGFYVPLTAEQYNAPRDIDGADAEDVAA